MASYYLISPVVKWQGHALSKGSSYLIPTNCRCVRIKGLEHPYFPFFRQKKMPQFCVKFPISQHHTEESKPL